MALSCIISEIKRNIGRKLRFIAFAFDARVRGVPIGILPYRLMCKTRMVWLPDCEKSLRIRLTVSTEHRRVTDRQTDILRRHSPRYALHRAVKCNAYRVVHQPVSRGFAVFADAWLSGWLAEISADLREAVAH